MAILKRCRLCGLVLMGLLLGAHPSAGARSDDAIYPFDKFGGTAFGKYYSVHVTDELLKKSPQWLKDSPHPPVSPRQALAAAGALANELVGMKKRYRRHLVEISLKPVNSGWVWLVKFHWLFEGISTGIPDNLAVVVTMDGKAVRPKIADLSKTVPPLPR